MSKYTSAFDKIRVTPDMETRILANLEKESRRAAEMPKKRSNLSKHMRLVYAMAACCVFAFSVFIFVLEQKDPKPPVGVVNPYKSYRSIDELKKALPFKLGIPIKMPIQYKMEGIDSISGKMANIRYSDGNNTIVYRAAIGREDISGDTNEYTSVQTKTIANIEVTFKGNDAMVFLAIWMDDTCSYSLSITQGMTEEQVFEIIKSLHL